MPIDRTKIIITKMPINQTKGGLPPFIVCLPKFIIIQSVVSHRNRLNKQKISVIACLPKELLYNL